MSLNYGILDSFKLLLNAFKYDIFISIIISSISYIVLLYINKNKKSIKYIVLGVNLILIIFILYYYLNDILKFNFNEMINNMYFYFINSICYFILIIIFVFKNKIKILDYIIYNISLIFIMFSLFMTYYLNNVDLIIIGNIFPMIKFGNIIYIFYYFIKIFFMVGDLIGKRKYK